MLGALSHGLAFITSDPQYLMLAILHERASKRVYSVVVVVEDG